MKLGIRTGKARTPVEIVASPGEGAGERPGAGPGEDLTLPERERGQASRPEDFASLGAGQPYRARHAADAAEAPLDSSELPTGLGPARHRR